MAGGVQPGANGDLGGDGAEQRVCVCVCKQHIGFPPISIHDVSKYATV
jgi:hypothetical protein